MAGFMPDQDFARTPRMTVPVASGVEVSAGVPAQRPWFHRLPDYGPMLAEYFDEENPYRALMARLAGPGMGAPGMNMLREAVAWDADDRRLDLQETIQALNEELSRAAEGRASQLFPYQLRAAELGNLTGEENLDFLTKYHPVQLETARKNLGWIDRLNAAQVVHTNALAARAGGGGAGGAGLDAELVLKAYDRYLKGLPKDRDGNPYISARTDPKTGRTVYTRPPDPVTWVRQQGGEAGARRFQTTLTGTDVPTTMSQTGKNLGYAPSKGYKYSQSAWERADDLIQNAINPRTGQRGSFEGAIYDAVIKGGASSEEFLALVDRWNRLYPRKQRSPEWWAQWALNLYQENAQ